MRALTQEEAAQGLPVRLRGVVLGEAEPSKPERGKAALVILDDTEGIYLWGPRPLASGIQRGDVIEVEGVSDPEPEPLRPGDEVKNLVDGARVLIIELISPPSVRGGRMGRGVYRAWRPLR